MSNQGWISLHRKLEDNPIFQNEKALKIWIWLLLRANHEPNDILIGRQLIHLKMGQFIFGSDVACERLKMSKSTIHWWLDYLKVERYIERKTTNRYSVITILNYERYQTTERQVEYRRNAKRTPSVQPNETNNKDNTVNTDNTVNKDTPERHLKYLLEIPEEQIQAYTKDLGVTKEQILSKAKELYNYCTYKHKSYSDYKLFLWNALKRDFKTGSTKYRTSVIV